MAGDRRRGDGNVEGTSGGGGRRASGIMASAATPLKAAANLFAGTVKWGLGLMTSPTDVRSDGSDGRAGPSVPANENGHNEDASAAGVDALEQAPPAVSLPPPMPPPTTVLTGDQGYGSIPDASQGASGYALAASPFPAPASRARDGRRQSLPAYALGESSAGGARAASAYASPYARVRKSLGPARPSLGVRAAADDVRTAEFAQPPLPTPVQPSSTDARASGSANHYDNVRAILRQGRRGSGSVVDRYTSAGKFSGLRRSSAGQDAAYLHAALSDSPARAGAASLGIGGGAGPAGPAAAVRWGAPPAPSAMATPSAPPEMMGRRRSNFLVTPAAAEATSPVHAFRRRSWTPMRSSGGSDRLRTLKRAHPGAENGAGNGEEGAARLVSPKRLRSLEPSPAALPSPRLGLGLGTPAATRPSPAPGSASRVLTTDTAKRILSTLDALTQGSAEASPALTSPAPLPKRLKFDAQRLVGLRAEKQSAATAAAAPPPESLRHFSKAAAEGEEVIRNKVDLSTPPVLATEEPTLPPPRWPKAFLEANKRKADKAVEDAQREIDEAKGKGAAGAASNAGAGAGVTFSFGVSPPGADASKPTTPGFVFGKAKPALHAGMPASPIAGLQTKKGLSFEPLKGNQGTTQTPPFTFSAKGMGFGPSDAEEEEREGGEGATGAATSLTGEGKRTFSFGRAALSAKESAFDRALAGVKVGSASQRTFAFRLDSATPGTPGSREGGAGPVGASLKVANETAIKAAACPLPSDASFDSPATKAPSPSSSPSSFPFQAPAKTEKPAPEVTVGSWPAAFLSANKKQAEEAVAAVEEEIKKAKEGALGGGEGVGAAAGAKEGGNDVFKFPAKTDTTPFSFGAGTGGKDAAFGEKASAPPPLFSFGAAPTAAPTQTAGADKPLAFSFGAPESDGGKGKEKEGGEEGGDATKAGAPAADKGAAPFGGGLGGLTAKAGSAASSSKASAPFVFGSLPTPTPTLNPTPNPNPTKAGKESSLFSPPANGEASVGAAGKEGEGKSGPFGSSAFGSAPKQASAAFPFQFGAAQPKASETKPSEDPKDNGKPAGTAAPFTFGASAQSTPAAPAPATSFGATPAPAAAGAPSVAFGGHDAPTTTAPPPTTTPQFTFGATSAAASSPAPDGKASSGGGMFSLGGGTPSSSFAMGGQSSAPSPSPSPSPVPFTFGATTEGAKPKETAPKPGAGAFTFGSTPAFQPQASPSVFGSTLPAGAASSGGGLQGSAFPAAGANSGGMPGASPSPFGGPPQATFNPFSAPAPASTPAPAFGTGAASAPSFAFGAASAPAPNPVSQPQPGFGSAPAFGMQSVGGNANAGGNGGAFSFGASSQGFGANPATPSPFGAAPTPGAFGGAPPSMPQPAPAFGTPGMQPNAGMPAAANNSFGGFGFGSPMPAGNTGASPGGFSMGTSTSQQAGPGSRRKVRAKPSWRKK